MTDSPVTQPSMTTERRFLLWLAILAVLGFLCYLLRGALTPFLVGMAVAYMLDPLADRLERAGLPRGLAAIVIVAGFLIAFVTALIILVPILSAQVTDLVGRLPEYAVLAADAIRPYVEQLKAKLARTQVQGLETIVQQQGSELMGWSGQVFSHVISGGAVILSVLGVILISPVVAFYLLRDWDRLVARINDLLPRRGGERIRTIVREIDQRLSAFVRGQVLVMLILGVWYATGLVLIGLDFGLLLGVIAGLISIIPYVGNIIGLGIGIALAAVQFGNWQGPGLVAAVFASGQILEGYVIQPKIIGDRVGLHPVWLMFAVIAGSALLGFTGALLAVPVAAVIGVLVRSAIAQYLKSPLYLDTGPSEMAAEDEAPPR
ncbi:MAG: AI-2E family transporter [Defluviicoccus sp.]